MATAAQIDANRRNAEKSTGPRTPEGRKKSRFNALDHGCRANILVLPTEEFGEYESKCQAWKLSFKPRNPAEEFLIDRIVTLGCLTKRIDQAQTARLATRMHYGVFAEDAKVDGEVIELGQKLFLDACGQQVLHLQDMGRPGRPRDYSLGLPQIRTCTLNASGSSRCGISLSLTRLGRFAVTRW